MATLKLRRERPTTAQKPVIGAILLVLGVLLTGCGWQGTGTVAAKNHTDGYWYSTMICSGYDSKGNCTSWMPVQNWVPDDWTVTIRDAQGATHTVSVNEAYYNAAKSGDAFDNREKK